MTKKFEIEILLDALKELGQDSYCGPWLEQQIPFIERDMRSDMFPSASWVHARNEAIQIRTNAVFEAESIVEHARQKAQAEAERIVKDARVQAAQIASSFRQAMKLIEHY